MVTSGLRWASAVHLASKVDKVRGRREGSRVRAVKYGTASMSLSAIAARPEFACTHSAAGVTAASQVESHVSMPSASTARK